MVRGKFQVDAVTEYSNKVKEIVLTAVTGDETSEDVRFHKYTPSGSIKIVVDNPPAAELFQPGRKLYVDFTDATPIAGGKAAEQSSPPEGSPA